MSGRAERAGERDAARARHPSVRRAIDLDLMRRRETERLSATGHRRPGEAASLLAARGHLGLDRATFADVLGVAESDLAELEDEPDPR